MTTASLAQAKPVAHFLRATRGFDFTAYKPATLVRRLHRRMQDLKIPDYASYKAYLEGHPDEFALFFNSLLINVTHFFRDAPVWEKLASDIIPNLVDHKSDGGPIRVWSAGCSYGQEPYSLAILLVEQLGIEQFRQRVKIYATDVDDEALVIARQASYPKLQLKDVDETLRTRYFEAVGDHLVFRSDLRRTVIFGRHDLLQDPPISRIDLLVCRNTLMYFNAEAQSRVLARFFFALEEHGFMVLGKAEMLLTHTDTFTPVDQGRKIFVKVGKDKLRDRMLLITQAAGSVQEPSGSVMRHIRLRELAYDLYPHPDVVIDKEGRLALANETARKAFHLSAVDIGQPLQNLPLSYRPVELRAQIERCHNERRPIRMTGVQWPDGPTRDGFVDIDMQPLLGENGEAIGVNITFIDVTQSHRIPGDLHRSNQELETAQEELHSTNEELETTNEELQSTVEELETTNEELQSTNEELETMNEELQSTNDELRLINDQLQLRTMELNHVNDFHHSVLGGMRVGVAVLDCDMRVLTWNRKAEDMWGLRTDEVRGQLFLGLDIGLPVSELKNNLRECVSGRADAVHRVLQATNRRGKAITCRVECSPLVDASRQTRGAILFMEERPKPGAKKASAQRARPAR